MTGSVALDVVIGLVFIYLLYSLFATVIMEILNTFLGLRARNLRYSLRRMLMDEKEFGSNNNLKKKVFRVFINHLLKITGKAYNLMKPELFNNFYDQPSIKYLSGGGLWNKPSYISSQNFSKALIDSLKELGDNTKGHPIERVKSGIEKVGIEQPDDQAILEDSGLQEEIWIKKTRVEAKHFFRERLDLDIEHESSTKKHLVSLLEDANNDLQKFDYLLQQWFNDTMERSTGWFKRRVQYFLFLIGFILAISLNADTLSIIKKLSNDTKAREQLVTHASNYTKDNETLIEKINAINKESAAGQAIDSLKKEESINEVIKSNNDSLRKISQILKDDIVKAQSIIASNWHIPDRIFNDTVKDIPKDFIKHNYKLVVWDTISGSDNKKKVKKDKVDISILVHKSIDIALLEQNIRPTSRTDYVKGIINVNKRKYKWSYVFASKGLNFFHLWGYILTALAISLGSPFWFDLLNKLIKLRSSIKPSKQENPKAYTTSNNQGTLINRVG